MKYDYFYHPDSLTISKKKVSVNAHASQVQSPTVVDHKDTTSPTLEDSPSNTVDTSALEFHHATSGSLLVTV